MAWSRFQLGSVGDNDAALMTFEKRQVGSTTHMTPSNIFNYTYQQLIIVYDKNKAHTHYSILFDPTTDRKHCHCHI